MHDSGGLDLLMGKVLCFVDCSLNQKSMAVVMGRTIHQMMSLTRGTALGRLI